VDLDTWLLKPAGVFALAIFACGWIVQSLQLRSHLSQAVQDLRRLHRLSRRLGGCVWELNQCVASQLKPIEEVSEPIICHVAYLFAIRQECGDLASQAARHSVRLRWADGYLSRRSLAAKRCELANENLRIAASALADACKVYERNIGQSLMSGTPSTSDIRPAAPITLLDEVSASQLAQIRVCFDEAVRALADVTGLRDWTVTMHESMWPIRHSELPASAGELYGGEIRPMGWTGFGSRPIIHVDAR
jgi:hypothetical protein